MTTARRPQPQPRKPLDSIVITDLDRLIARQEAILVDLRRIRADLAASIMSQGVLGSRGLTQFVLETLRQTRHDSEQRLRTGSTITLPAPGLTIKQLLLAAERAGYSIPTARILSKRLVERRLRTGDVDYSDELGWYWTGN